MWITSGLPIPGHHLQTSLTRETRSSPIQRFFASRCALGWPAAAQSKIVRDRRVYLLRRSRGTVIQVTGVWTPFRICAVLLLFLTAPEVAQPGQRPPYVPVEVEPGPMPDPSQGMIRLDVVVTDKSGNPVAGLGQQDFTLEDNGQPGKIVSFQAVDGVTAKPDPPVEVILVIDELNMAETPKHGEAPLLDAKREAENFLRQNQGRLGQPVSIYRLTNDG